MNQPTPHVEVAIALCWRDGRLLVTRRPAGVHLSGHWEFPGGKLAHGETPENCAERELYEETAVVASARSRRPPIDWEYPERRVTLHPVDCDWVEGNGTARQVAELRWALPSELAELEFPEANAELVATLFEYPRAMALDDDFASAKTRVEKLPKTPGSDELLELYSLYKQATQGDVTGSRPGMLDFKGRAKWDAWSTRRGMTKDAAKQGYVDLVGRLEKKYA